MSILGDLAQFRLMGYLSPTDFTLTQMGIGVFRDVGRDIQKKGRAFLVKHFYNGDNLKPFLKGMGSMGKDLFKMASTYPMYLTGAGAGTYGLYQLGKVMEAHAYPADLPLGKRIKEGFKDNILDITNNIFDNPLYTISGVAAVGILGKMLHDHHKAKIQKEEETQSRSK